MKVPSAGAVDMSDRRIRFLVTGVAALVAVALYANSLANGFAYDDDFIIKNRELVHGLEGLGRVLLSPYWPEGFAAGLYRPLTLLTYALDWEIWGGHPFGFHLVNVVLHAAVSALVVLLLLRFFPSWAALAGGLVFAVHSIHTEAVANVVGRAELLVALFTLAACLIYTRALSGSGITLRSGLAITVLYALAGLSKEAGVVLPGLLLVTDLPRLRSCDRKRLADFVRRRLPLFMALTGLLLLIFAARWLALGTPLENQPDRAFALDDSFATRFFTMARVWPRYLELLLFPLSLSADYSPGVILPATGLTPVGLAGILLVFATVALAVALHRRMPEFGMAVAWAAIALLPVSNLIIMAEIVLAERTLYLPSVAVSILVALLLSRVGPPRRRWVVAAVAAWVALFSVVTIRRNPVWDSTNTVFEDLRRTHPESSRLLFGVATMLYNQGDWERAEEWFDHSIRVWPHHAPYRSEYAMYLVQHGKLEKADSLVAGAVRLRPDWVDYRILLALIRFEAKDYEGSRRALEEGLAVIGPDRELYAMLADVLLALDRPDDAVAAQQRVITLAEDGPSWQSVLRLAAFQYAAGDSAAARVSLARAKAELGADPAAVEQMRRVWEAPPAETLEAVAPLPDAEGSN